MIYDVIDDVFDWNFKRNLTLPPIDVDLEYRMLLEELDELLVAETKVDVADALADIVWVALGSLSKLTKSPDDVSLVMQAVSKANWTKKADTKNGKITKPDDFVGPEKDIDKIINKKTGTLL